MLAMYWFCSCKISNELNIHCNFVSRKLWKFHALLVGKNWSWSFTGIQTHLKAIYLAYLSKAFENLTKKICLKTYKIFGILGFHSELKIQLKRMKTTKNVVNEWGVIFLGQNWSCNCKKKKKKIGCKKLHLYRDFFSRNQLRHKLLADKN